MRTSRLGILVTMGVVGIALTGCFQGGPSGTASSSAASTPQVLGSTGGTTASSGAATEPVATTTETPAPVAQTKPLADTANDVVHQPTWVVKATDAGGKQTITLDYVQWLTGKAAEKAAKAHGDTVENDYYVVNDNKKLRTFPLASSAKITVRVSSDPSVSRDFSFSEFKSLLKTHSATYGGLPYDWNPQAVYYVTVKHGKITHLDHQWVP